MTREACSIGDICYEVRAYALHYGEEPTVLDMARWLGATLDTAGGRVDRAVEHGMVARIWPARVRKPVRGGPRKALALTETGQRAADGSAGLAGIPREAGEGVPVAYHVSRRDRTSPDHDASRRRVTICHEVVREMGISRDEDEHERCPVIHEVERRWDAEDLGGAPWTLLECGVVLGVGRERVRQIEERAMEHVRTRLHRQANDIREQLRELDAGRDHHWSCESAA